VPRDSDAARKPKAGIAPGAYRAPWWARNRHVNTIYASLIGKRLPLPPMRRERWEMPDGDFIDVDWLAGERPAGTPLVVLFHGLEGSSDSHYVRTFARQAERHGWRFAMPHFRSCSGEPNRLPRAYHSGDSEDIDWMLKRFHGAVDGAPLFAAGVSLGGNALLKWLGERGEEGRRWVRAAAAVCAPLDLTLSGEALARGFNMVYTRMFLKTLKKKSAGKLASFPGIFDEQAMRRSRTFRDFDDAVTAPLHGFSGADDYWTRSSAGQFLSRIALPTLVLNARDDPFVPPGALPDPQGLPDWLTVEFPQHGGHVGFVRGFPVRLDWLPERVFHHFEHHMSA